MNNGGWQIFRPVAERQDLLSLPEWSYAEMARCWGGWGRRVQSVAELREGLAAAAAQPTFALLEIVVSPQDLSPITRKYIAASAKKAGS